MELGPTRSLTGASDGLATGWATALSYASASPQSVSPDEHVSKKKLQNLMQDICLIKTAYLIF